MIEPPLLGGVAMVLSVAADITRGSRIGDNQVWVDYHQTTLLWQLQDSVNSDVWHTLGSGTLYDQSRQAVLRISSPIACVGRIRLRANASIAAVRHEVGSDRGSTEKVTNCPRMHEPHCRVDHSALSVANIKIGVVVL